MASLRDTVIGVVGRALGMLFKDKPWTIGFQPKRILIIKTCCIGDVLMATPTLDAIRQALPDSAITLMVGSWSKAIVQDNPNVDDIIDCGDLGSGRHYGVGDYLRLVRTVRRRRFDCCIVLERSPILTSLPWLAGIPVRVGLDSAGRGFSLTVRVPCPDRRHEAELYLDTVRAVGYEPVDPHLAFYPTDEDDSRAESLLASLGDDRLVAIHPGGGVNPGMCLVTKRWPPDRFAALADRLIGHGYRVLLVGATSDRPLVDAVKRGMRGQAVDLIGLLSLGELGAVLQRCHLMVANDTGPMHLAVAVGTAVVAIFGPSDPAVYGPYRQQGAVASCHLDCSPCFKGGRAPACPEARCMTGLTVDVVWELVLARLDASGAVGIELSQAESRPGFEN